MNKSKKRSLQSAGFALTILGCVSVACADWTVTMLTAPSAGVTIGLSVSRTQQVGAAFFSPIHTQASLWTGTPASWLSLHPVGWDRSYAYGTSGDQQVGYVEQLTGRRLASLWTGSASSWTSLHPADPRVSRSIALAVAAGEQVGFVALAGNNHAALWHGGASTWVDLHPAIATASTAQDTSGVCQVGSADIGFVSHAGLWNGSAASWIDLHPNDPRVSSSYGAGVFGEQQVGSATVDGNAHAALWTGSASSWRDLHPAEALYSVSAATCGEFQVGTATFPGDAGERAIIWNGSSESWEDLSLALPGTWIFTRAEDVWCDGVEVRVVGYGHQAARNVYTAILWSRPITVCAPDLNRDGIVDFADYLEFLNLYCAQDRRVDFNQDGLVDFGDYLAFLDLYEAGC